MVCRFVSLRMDFVWIEDFFNKKTKAKYIYYTLYCFILKCKQITYCM